IEKVLHNVEDGRTSESAAIKLIRSIVEHSGDHGHAHDFEYDPHIWLDPILAKQQVMVIKEALVRADPVNAAYYEENAMEYNAKLDALDAKIRSELSSCKKDTFVPFHNAFSYLAQRYNLNVFALSGIAPESEATAAELKRLVDYVRDNEIKVVFAEDLVDPRLAQILANEAGAQVLILSPLEGISKDDMSAGKTYLDKMEENITNLKVALECQ
ncbi:MAG: zinc ABC transporter substrate-binding protein, partial [Candidatus Nitrosotenuis sp.]